MKSKIKFIPVREDIFLLTLKDRVGEYFRVRGISKKANTAMWVKASFMISGMFTLYFLLLFATLSSISMLLCAFLLGVFIAGVGCNIAHDALHNTFSDKRWVNQLLGNSMDFIGSNSYLWKINHNAHHFYTNISGIDGDIRENELIRFSPHNSHKNTHHFQVLTSFFVYGAFFLLIIYSFNINNFFKRNLGSKESIKHPKTEIAKLIFWKLFYLVIWVVIPYSFIAASMSEFILGYLVMNFTAGYLLAFNFMAPHNFEETTYISGMENEKVSWAKHQLRTTCNFNTKNPLLSYFIGGLNYQIEHHLFPDISSIHYPEISKIVKQVAEDFNVQYYQKDSFLSIILSHLKVLDKHSHSNA